VTDEGAPGHRACAKIATLTLNPTIDTSMDAEKIVPTDKIRTSDDRLDPGGGGINVARVLVRFGAPVHAIFMAGGSTGRLLDRLLQREGVERTSVPIAGETRVSVTVYERSTGHEYRFVPEGPVLSDPEWQDCLKRVEDSDCPYFVASGSLPRGVPADFYARLADKLAGRSRFVLDTSGDELKLAVAGGDIFLLKTSRKELEEVSGKPLAEVDAIAAAASRIVSDGHAQNVAVTLGADGALLATRHGAEYMPAIPVEARSTVGAGDSFLAAMTYAFASGADSSAALRLGIAAGAAATLSPGTNLCHPWDVTRLAMREGAVHAVGKGQTDR
jgi:6-phosphofructokinase 2